MLAKLPPDRGIVPVHAADEVWWEGKRQLCLVMGFIEGRSLAHYARDPNFPTVSALATWCAQTCEALAIAHAQGVIHRDVKPSNIIISDNHAWLIDFGISSPQADSSSASGFPIGTPPYMSPEQASLIPLTGLSDLYSVGVMFFELLTGELPFQHQVQNDGWASYLMTVRTEYPPSLAGGPANLGAVMDSLLRRVKSGHLPFPDAVSAARGLRDIASICRAAEAGKIAPLPPIKIIDDLGYARTPARGMVEVGADFSYSPERLDGDTPEWARGSDDTRMDWQRKYRFRNRRLGNG